MLSIAEESAPTTEAVLDVLHHVADTGMAIA